MPDTHYVIIADIIGSRKIPAVTRQQLQRLLEALVNVIAKSGWCVCVGVSSGDGITGLFESKDSATQTLWLIKAALWNVPVRFGLGAGIWTVRMNGDIHLQDGEPFWNASDAITIAKSRDHLFKARGLEINEAIIETGFQSINMRGYDETTALLHAQINKATYPLRGFSQAVSQLYFERERLFQQEGVPA